MSQSSLPAPDPPGRLKRNFIRYTVRLLADCYLRVRLEGIANIPEPPYLLCFNHPNWVDPFLILAWWPKRHQFFIFGPKEYDMSVGWRNRLIAWGQGSVAFKPSRSDLIETTKKAMGVLANGYVLGIAGEGRLSDREGAIVPLQDGAAFLALRGRVPIVPVAIIGTRWLRFGKRIRLQVGAPIELGDRRANREGVESVLAELTAAYERLLEGVVEEPPPGPVGRWVTDLFNDRPWLTDPNWDHPPPRGDAPRR